MCKACSNDERKMPNCNCPDGKYDDNENAACVECPANCATCFSENTCRTCKGLNRVVE